ncbi:MAG TPA: DUF4440 domain-containing protein [Candidatus Sulfotelmatobacter sp.]|nr:DUF4440 domain-containing protein [Candidatus Sulfotelmatobacter sp.]
MRPLALLLQIFLLATPGTLRASSDPLAAEQKEVLKVHQVMTEAARKRDFENWSHYVADDCIFSDDEGQLTTKAEIIEHLRNMPLAYDHSENHREFLAHIYGETAVLNFRLTAHEQFTDSDIVTEMRDTQTFVRRNGAWLLIAEQWGTLPLNYRKAVTIDSSRLQDFAGRYEWRSGGPVDNVTLKDGKLLTRMTGESEDREYMPLGSETFFLKNDLGTVMFIRDKTGQVVGYVYHRPDGQEIHVKKVN